METRRYRMQDCHFGCGKNCCGGNSSFPLSTSLQKFLPFCLSMMSWQVLFNRHRKAETCRVNMQDVHYGALNSGKVSKLLSSIYLMSTVDGPISVTCSSQSMLSTSHWAAFFHQASVGTYLPCQCLAYWKDTACFPNVFEDPRSIMLDAVIEASNILSFAPDRLEHLEDFVREFFQSLPSVPIICISFLEDRILDVPEVQLESVKEWQQCPWSYSVIDYVAQVFKQFLKESCLLVSLDTRNFWSQRADLDKHLKKLMSKQIHGGFASHKRNTTLVDAVKYHL